MVTNTSDNDTPQWPGTQVTQWPGQKVSASQKNQDLSLIDVPGQALAHLGSSAKELGKSLVQPFIHPVQTVENIGKLGLGVGEKLGIPGTEGYGQYADAVGQFFKDRYGGYENIKRTIANDPVGFAADIATVATGGETALARLPGVAGKVGEISGEVAKYTNPLNVAKAVPAAGKIASTVGGIVTGKGAENISQAARAGFRGDQTFIENLRDPDVNAPELITRARKALAEMRMERSTAYQNGMLGVKADNSPLDFDKIDDAISKARRIKQFEGFDISQLAGANEKLAAEKVRDRIESAVNSWRTLPDKFRTAAGMDALKQYIGDVRDSHQYGTPERKVADEIYSAVRQTIVDQRPEYAAVMRDYEKASDMLGEVEKTLSLRKGTTGDTALRKLLSAGRSNVNTNFGRRLELAEELNRRDPRILPAIAGQSLAPYAPGGLVGAGAGIGGATELGSLLAHGVAGLNPTVLASILATSPRLWGELAYKAGQAGRKARGYTPQQIIDLYNRGDLNVLSQLGLGSRAIGGVGATQ